MFIRALTGGGTKTARSHFIFEKGGILVEKKNPVKPADRYAVSHKRPDNGSDAIFFSPKLALEFIKGLDKDTDAMAVDAPTNVSTDATTEAALPVEATSSGEAVEA